MEKKINFTDAKINKMLKIKGHWALCHYRIVELVSYLRKDGTDQMLHNCGNEVADKICGVGWNGMKTEYQSYSGLLGYIPMRNGWKVREIVYGDGFSNYIIV